MEKKINEEIDFQLFALGVECPKSQDKYRQRVWNRLIEISIDVSHDTIKKGRLKKTCDCKK